MSYARTIDNTHPLFHQVVKWEFRDTLEFDIDLNSGNLKNRLEKAATYISDLCLTYVERGHMSSMDFEVLMDIHFRYMRKFEEIFKRIKTDKGSTYLSDITSLARVYNQTLKEIKAVIYTLGSDNNIGDENSREINSIKAKWIINKQPYSIESLGLNKIKRKSSLAKFI